MNKVAHNSTRTSTANSRFRAKTLNRASSEIVMAIQSGNGVAEDGVFRGLAKRQATSA